MATCSEKSSSYPWLFLILIFCINQSYSQKHQSPDASYTLQQITKAIDTNAPLNYKAQMRLKEFGSDTFEVRNFSIFYNSNTENPLYGYDWQISEVRSSGHALTLMTSPESYYMIYDGNKTVNEYDLPEKIDLASYREYIRNSLVLCEVLSPFVNASPRDILIADSSSTYSLTRILSDQATRQLIVNKDDYLPIRSIIRISDPSLNLVQITEINFLYEDYMRILPDSALSIEHFTTQGYTRNKYVETYSRGSGEIQELSPELIDLLLQYPFVTSTGDSISIASLKAEYIVLDFWYASCLPCLKALPEMNQLAEDYAGQGVVVLGINCFDMGIKPTLVSTLRDKMIAIPLWFGSRDLVQSLHINSFPTYLLITPDYGAEFIEGNTEDLKKILSNVVKK